MKNRCRRFSPMEDCNWGYSPNQRSAGNLKEFSHESHESTRISGLVLFVQIRVIRSQSSPSKPKRQRAGDTTLRQSPKTAL